MELQVIIAGAILGLMMTIILEDRSSKEKSYNPRRVNRNSTRATNIYTNPTAYSRWRLLPNDIPYHTTRARARPGSNVMPRRMDISRLRMGRQNLVETWRRSVMGLLWLADKNLEFAQRYLKLEDYTNCIKAASTSVENIARALIHCFGGKPDPDSGQQEPLRLLATRLPEEEKAQFEGAVELVAYIDRNRRTLEHLSTNEMRSNLFDKSKAKAILTSASKIIIVFKRVIINHFLTEIPVLAAICPECGSSDCSIWGFNESNVNYQCNVCRQVWTRRSKNVEPK